MPKLFITGATGYIGSAVARAFKKKGYEIHALVRSKEAEEKVRKQGYTPVQGGLENVDVIERAAASADIAVHTAADYESDVNRQDELAVRAIVKGLKGSNKPFIYTSGVWVLGNTINATEETPTNAIELVAWRVSREAEVLAAAKDSIRTVVIRPGIVYGEQGGIIDQLVELAEKEGTAKYIENGENHWTLVHVEDLAELYVLAAQDARPGSLYHATTEEHITLKQIAEQIARVIGSAGKVASWPIQEARKVLGVFADGLALDQKVDSSKAKRELGWVPKKPALSEAISNTPLLSASKK